MHIPWIPAVDIFLFTYIWSKFFKELGYSIEPILQQIQFSLDFGKCI